MARAIFCWELGSNYGHVAGFLPLHKELTTRGVDVRLIVRERKTVSLLGEEVLEKTLQAPYPKHKRQPVTIHSFAGILAETGYLDEQALTLYINDWREMLKAQKPDFIIADYAPTAILAARSLGIPIITIGTGFTLPPTKNNCFPPFFTELTASDGSLENKILTTINRALQNLNAEPLKNIDSFLDGCLQLICSFAEQDHYGARDNVQYCGPLFSDNLGGQINWPDSSSTRIFAYLTDKIRGFDRAVHAITELPGHKVLHIPSNTNFDETILGKRTDIEFIRKPIAMRSVFNGASLIISQGGIGTNGQALIHGVPQVVIPTQNEQRMLARRMLVQKLTKAADHHQVNVDFYQVFHSALYDQVMHKSAAEIAHKYSAFSQADQVSSMVQNMFGFLQQFKS